MDILSVNPKLLASNNTDIQRRDRKYNWSTIDHSDNMASQEKKVWLITGKEIIWI